MPRDPAPDEGAVRAREAGAGDGRGELVRLLRSCHVFSALVHQVLGGEVVRAACRHPLSATQLQLLKLATGNGPRRVGEVTALLGASPPATTKNVDKLERLGLLIRRRAPGDRRATLLVASAEGARLVGECEALAAQRLAAAADALARVERVQLTRLLERLCTHLLAASEGRGGPCMRCAGYFDPGCPLLGLVQGCPGQPAAAVGAGGSAGAVAEEVL